MLNVFCILTHPRYFSCLTTRTTFRTWASDDLKLLASRIPATATISFLYFGSSTQWAVVRIQLSDKMIPAQYLFIVLSAVFKSEFYCKIYWKIIVHTLPFHKRYHVRVWMNRPAVIYNQRNITCVYTWILWHRRKKVPCLDPSTKYPQ